MPKKLFRAVYALNYVMQAGFSFVVPAGLFIGAGWLLTERGGFGRWVMAATIVLGVLSGLYSMFYYIVKTMNHVDPTEGKEERRGGKNESSAD